MLTAGSVLVLSLIPLVFYGRFYFQDDTENGAYGVWYHLGESLFQGQVPVLNPSVWSSGNYIAEGQWGTWNPLVMLFGVLAYISPNAVVLTTALKVAMLVAAGVGTFVLARSYSLSPEWAFIAGIAVPLNGFTMYFDAPSWVTGALVWAIFPFFWAELRQLMAGKRNPFWAFITGYLIVTVGYVAGTVAVGFILLAVGVETLIRKAWRPAIRIAVTGVSMGLVAVVVFLPGVLTAAVTTRGTTGIWNDDYMSIDFNSLLMAPIATAYPQLLSWWWSGTGATSPAAYIAWFLPAIAFVSWSRFKKLSPELRDLFFFLAAALAFVLLPTTIGPLRYPARFMPYVATGAVLLVIVALARARRPHIGRPSLYFALGLVVLGSYLWLGAGPLALLHNSCRRRGRRRSPRRAVVAPEPSRSAGAPLEQARPERPVADRHRGVAGHDSDHPAAAPDVQPERPLHCQPAGRCVHVQGRAPGRAERRAGRRRRPGLPAGEGDVGADPHGQCLVSE